MQGKTGKTAARKQAPQIKKPYLRGRAVSALAFKRGFKILGFLLVSAFLFLFLGQVMVIDIAWLRVLINLAIIAGFAALMFSSGASQGEGDVSFAEIALNRQNEGKTVSNEDLARCFHPLKGFVTVLAGTLIFVIICLVYAFMAKKDAYTLGVLPTWLSAYQGRQDIALALDYYRDVKAFGLMDVLRIIVRLLIFPFINLVGSNNPDGVLLVERLSPLLVLVAPSFYGFGYLRGEAIRAMVHGGIAKNARKAARRQKKKAAPRSAGPKELV